MGGGEEAALEGPERDLAVSSRKAKAERSGDETNHWAQKPEHRTKGTPSKECRKADGWL